MKKKLELLCNYLKKNGYEDDSKRVEVIMHDITKADFGRYIFKGKR